MGDWKRRTFAPAAGPSATGFPVSPSKPRRRPSSSAPTTHTIGSDLPSVVVTIGEPRPGAAAHQATSARGGEPGTRRAAVRFPPPEGQPTPEPRKTT